MIRINLLPVRAAKKKETLRFQLTVAWLVTVLVFIISMGIYIKVRSQASNLTADISSGNQELEELKKKIGELSKIKEQKRIVEEKLRIINNLEAARKGPIMLFDMITSSIPEKAWLLSLKDEDPIIEIKGAASADEVIADFMRGLQRYKELGKVELDVAQRGLDRETNSEVVNFTIRLEKEREKKATDGAKH